MKTRCFLLEKRLETEKLLKIFAIILLVSFHSAAVNVILF